MIQSPVNNVLLRVSDIFLKYPSDILKMSHAYSPASRLNPADLVQIVGEVMAVPKSISNKRLSYEGFSAKDIKVGDTAIFRYDVIYSWTSDKKRFKNMFYYRGKEYWVADIQKIFAVIRRGEIIMVNGYCMIEDVSKPSLLLLPQALKKMMQVGSATLTHIGDNLTHLKKINAEPGDTVYFNPTIVQHYEIKGKPFSITRQKDIYGVKIAGYSELLP